MLYRYELTMKDLKHLLRICLCSITVLLLMPGARAQEQLAPLDNNPFVRPGIIRKSTAKTTALSLPFFEDFTGYDAIPDTGKWEDRQVYINNTMGVNPVSRGMATFDAISQYGVPYDTLNPNSLNYADSLTARPVDLSVHTPADSLYLSFFYQPQGNGFAPDGADSLMLYFRKKGAAGAWVKVWSTIDTVLKPFRQVMVPVTDTDFFYASFQFRFVNKASLGINDDVWNLDYIRLDAGRSVNDTAVNDIAFTQTPGFLLNDYTYMPYRQYLANISAERAAEMKSVVANQNSTSQLIPAYGYKATELISNTALASDSKTALSIAAAGTAGISLPTYSAVTPIAGLYDKVVFENKFYLQATAATGNKENDTIVGAQVFDNYLAYDDGTAEMSYFLNLFPTLPGKIAIEQHLNQADTLRGMAIYFGRQVPMATMKYFSCVVYKNIAFGSSTADNIIYQIDNLRPLYRDTINHFCIYKFDKPVPVPAGTFYIGMTQPALSGSDNLYIGLDRNRAGGNHAYYNVLNVWRSSLVEGALMIRPLLGQAVSGTGITETLRDGLSVNLYPDPATDVITVRMNTPGAEGLQVQVTDINGRIVMPAAGLAENGAVDISVLQPGVYLMKIASETGAFSVQKFIKQ